MKTGKLKGVSTIEAAAIVAHLGGKTLLYRDVPIMHESQIGDVMAEYKENNCDSVLFDTGALFDAQAYALAKDFVEKLEDPVVVIYNIAE